MEWPIKISGEVLRFIGPWNGLFSQGLKWFPDLWDGISPAHVFSMTDGSYPTPEQVGLEAPVYGNVGSLGESGPRLTAHREPSTAHKDFQGGNIGND